MKRCTVCGVKAVSVKKVPFYKGLMCRKCRIYLKHLCNLQVRQFFNGGSDIAPTGLIKENKK